MKSTRSKITVLAAVAALVGVGAASWRAGAYAPSLAAPPTSVAIVDLTTVIGSLKEVQVRNESLEAQKKADDAELKKIADELRKAQEDFTSGVIDADSPEGRRKRADMFEKQALGRARKEAFEGVRDLQAGEGLGQMYDKILATVSQLAAKDGYDLVIVDDRSIVFPKDEKGRLQNVSKNQAEAIMSTRRILFAVDRIDITQQVVQKMNAEYNAPKK
jgi:Skp family chaperone for outer membrane proteins